jgi:hypothetical protein
MRNKELALRRIQNIQAKVKMLNMVINRGTNEERVNTMKELTELLNDLQNIVEREN